MNVEQYQYLADFYKYTNPQKHLYYYQLYYSNVYEYSQQQREIETAPQELSGNLRFLHAALNTQEVDIYLNDTILERSFRFSNKSDYEAIPEGSYQISIFPANTKNTPLLSGYLQVENDAYYTIAIAGNNENVDLFIIEDDVEIPQNESKFRVWNLSQYPPSIDVAVKKGDVVFSDIGYSEVTEYLAMTPMTVDLEVRQSGTTNSIRPLNRVSLKPNFGYTIVLISHSADPNSLYAIFLVP